MDKLVSLICVLVVGIAFFGFYVFAIFAADLIALGLLYWKKPEWFQ